jgi:hypothetical protein
MSKVTSKQSKAASANTEMRAEYDFGKMTGGVRGKYYKGYRAGHTVKIHQDDGTTIIQHFKLEDGAVVIEPDVREYFPDEKAVNNALRCLIPLMPKKRKTKIKA